MLFADSGGFGGGLGNVRKQWHGNCFERMGALVDDAGPSIGTGTFAANDGGAFLPRADTCRQAVS
ncbi:hypothetical protein RLIN73S_03681 [Rhodanobacter lindaniclasticus]